MIDAFSLIGWAGMILLIVAYFLLFSKKIKSDSWIYNLLNFLGGIGILINALYAKLWAVVVLNIFWIAIASVSIFKILNKKPVYKELS